MIPSVMFNEVLLPIMNCTASDNRAWPVFARLVHSHFVFLPIRFGLEGFQDIYFRAVGAEHKGRFSGLALALLALRVDR